MSFLGLRTTLTRTLSQPFALVRRAQSSYQRPPGQPQPLSSIVESSSHLQPRMHTLNQYQVRFSRGALYDPRSLDERLHQRKTPANKLRRNPQSDRFTAKKMNPLHEYKSINMLSNYVSVMGRIKPRTQTGLTNKNQRLVAKAIRRARSFGLLPITYKAHAKFF
ncbi:hypothetical protein H4R33_000189 [Dimargaris cristalligena]|nr:hypothetical protein H4R33_000189 [Dimargaris cristalligena]